MGLTKYIVYVKINFNGTSRRQAKHPESLRKLKRRLPSRVRYRPYAPNAQSAEPGTIS